LLYPKSFSSDINLEPLESKAVSAGNLQRLTMRHATSSVLLFADDVVVFCNPDHGELAAIRAILQALGKAFGLCTNIALNVRPFQFDAASKLPAKSVRPYHVP
jgi:hypothetical protein